jgi:hypothetical protein
VSFFDPPPPPSRPPNPPPRAEWDGPPDGELPGFVPVRVTLWRDGEVAVFLDADHAVLRWVVHGTTPTPRRLDARLVRTPDGWRIRRASVLHVFRLAGVPAPPE